MEIQHFEGVIRKMRSYLTESVNYWLPIGDDEVKLSELVGETIRFNFLKQIYCIACGRKTNKSFNQGFCFPCFKNSPHNSECIIRPELCRGHIGEGRDPQWEEDNHNKPHVVYMAVSSEVKVGVTRDIQVPTRWIDQGAWRVMKLAETQNRYQAGMIEVHLKKFATDKTQWQKMLKNERPLELDFQFERNRLIEQLQNEYKEFICDDLSILDINYPVIQYPSKIKSHNLDKEPLLQGKLMGIKGQYLIFDGGTVINMRKYAGYNMELEF